MFHEPYTSVFYSKVQPKEVIYVCLFYVEPAIDRTASHGVCHHRNSFLGDSKRVCQPSPKHLCYL